MKNILLLFFLTMPAAVFAQGGGRDSAAMSKEAECSDGLSFCLNNPLGSNIGSVESLITAILNVLLIIAIPVIVFFIIFAGFSYVTAQGNPEKIKTATRSITYALIGGILILGATALTEVITNLVNEFRT